MAGHYLEKPSCGEVRLADYLPSFSHVRRNFPLRYALANRRNRHHPNAQPCAVEPNQQSSAELAALPVHQPIFLRRQPFWQQREQHSMRFYCCFKIWICQFFQINTTPQPLAAVDTSLINFDTSSLLFVTVWSLASVGVGLICGFFIGRSYTLNHEPKKLQRGREQTVEAMMNLVQSTKKLNKDVDCHNSALATAHEELGAMQTGPDMTTLQSALMLNIQHVVESNRRLEHDLVVSRYQMEEQAQELDRTRAEARTDALCKIGNRKAVDETLKFMVSRYQSEKTSFGLMLIDVDHFKRINDTFGHTAGDEVLTSIAIALKECVRPSDFVGRLGGDEFVIMLNGLNNENATLVGERIRSAIELYDFSIDSKGQSTVVTLSMGLAVVRQQDSVTTLYERADMALYRAKELGRNRMFTIVQDQDLNGNSEPPIMPTVTSEFGQGSYENFKAGFEDVL